MYTLYDINTKALINSTLNCEFSSINHSWDTRFRYYLETSIPSSYNLPHLVISSIMMRRKSLKHTWKTIELSDQYLIKLK